MSVLSVTEEKRKFQYKKQELDDIPGATLKEVAKHYSGIYPELLNSMPTFVKYDEKGVSIYDFTAKAGVKG